MGLVGKDFEIRRAALRPCEYRGFDRKTPGTGLHRCLAECRDGEPKVYDVPERSLSVTTDSRKIIILPTQKIDFHRKSRGQLDIAMFNMMRRNTMAAFPSENSVLQP